MLTKISDFAKWKKLLLIIVVVLSFALLKSYNLMALNAVNGWLLSTLLFLGYGLFYWLIFEVLIGFLYSGLKFKIEKNITLIQFNNIFRFFVIFCNLILYLISKLIIYINFYANFLLLIFNLIIIFIFLILMWYLLKKYFIKEIADNKLEMSYFGFVFMYLFLHTIMWGVL